VSFSISVNGDARSGAAAPESSIVLGQSEPGRLGAEVVASQSRVVGRESELAVIRGFVEADARRRAFVLAGQAGIGKTTLWEAGVDLARERGLRVLAARASSAETRLSFSALIDLCDSVPSESLAELAGPQRVALEVALLRAEPEDEAPSVHAIALGFRNVLRALSARTSVLIAIDDVQWLDAPSVEVLTFLVRRLKDEPVAFLLTRRADSATGLERVLQRGELRCLEVGPLSFGAIRRLLVERLGLSVSRQLLHRIVDVTLANPLFVLELGRELLATGVPATADELPVPAGIEDLLGMRVGSLPAPLRRVLVALALSADLRIFELAAAGGQGALDDAVDRGLVRVEGDRVRAVHPLVAAAAMRSAGRGERRELHLALARAIADEELRAMHLALATDETDGELSATVAAAAATASARGARQQAVALAEHALRLTPAGAEQRGKRVLELADYLERAGEMQRLTDLLTPEVELLPAGTPRARAWLMLSEGAGSRHMDDLADHHRRALAEGADDPGLRARVLAKQASNAAASTISDLSRAESWALAALKTAGGAGPDVQRMALYALAWVRAMTGRPVDDLCRSSQAASDVAAYIAAAPERVAGQRLVWRGEIPRARETLMRFLALADERGERESYALMRLHVCELHLRVGEWDAAEALLDEWAQSADRELMFRPKYERCRALLAAGRGDIEQTQRWATLAVARGEETGCRWDTFEGLRALAISHLLAHEPAAAAESLRIVWHHLDREGIDEPGVFPVAPELVQALTELGELQEAEAVTGRLAELADRQAHPWASITVARCRGVVVLAGSVGDASAADALERAAADYERIGLRFDAARSLLSLGRARRRLRQWGSARRAMEQAITAFDAMSSPGWAQQARSELERVGGRRPRASGELTQSEQRTAELAADGMSNKEIARELVVTVHTVEVHLSRAYAKLGVRSRAQLSGRLLAPGTPHSAGTSR
jgi:DNA-binding NarL/FixJ family response regulator